MAIQRQLFHPLFHLHQWQNAEVSVSSATALPSTSTTSLVPGFMVTFTRAVRDHQIYIIDNRLLTGPPTATLTRYFSGEIRDREITVPAVCAF